MPIARWRSIPKGPTLVLIFIVFLYFLHSSPTFQTPFSGSRQYVNVHSPERLAAGSISPVDLKDGNFHWANVPQQFPVASIRPLPTSKSGSIPRIQHKFKRETKAEREVRLERLDAVKSNFTHAWKGYKDHAWLRDEVRPVSGEAHDPFGGWAATLVDSLGSFLSVSLL